MCKYLQIFLCYIFVFKVLSSEKELLIQDFRDNFNECDYLIITARQFITEALTLAQHRNRFKGDDVVAARVITVDDLYTSSMLEDTTPKHIQIWSSLKWAYKNWKSPWRYLVFIGDDRIEWDFQKGKPVSTGLVPSYLWGYSIVFEGGIYPDTIFDFSDDFYTEIDKETYLDIKRVPHYKRGIALGRIPCETKKQCSEYIQKVIEYDNLSVSKNGWKNDILIIADDTLHEGKADLLGYAHMNAAETFSGNISTKNYKKSKIYFSQYYRGNLPLISDAFGAFKKNLENGKLWTVYFGHGSPGKLSDEGFIRGSDIEYLQNRDKPTILISLSCSNGSYHVPYKNSMCKQFLFSPGGAIVYIGSTFLEYADPNEKFADIFFKCADSLSGRSIGTTMAVSRQICSDRYPYTRLYHYHLLGDPAIKPSKLNVLGLQINFDGYRFVVKSENSLLKQGYYRICVICTDTIQMGDTSQIFITDSVLYNSEGTFKNFFDCNIPWFEKNSVKIKVFVWNNNVEAGIDTVINFENRSIAAGTKNNFNNKFTAKITDGIIHVEMSQKSGKNDKLWICNINGRLIAELPLPEQKMEFSIPLRNFVLASGTYILTIGNESKTVLFENKK